MLADQSNQLPAFEMSAKDERPRAAPTSTFKTWLPSICAVAVAFAVNVSVFHYNKGAEGITQPRRNSVVESHFEAFNKESRSTTEATESQSWFNDAKTPTSGIRSTSTGSRINWGTSRAYPPPVSSASDRKLYEAHVDVSDQFTTFGKMTISGIYFAFWIFLMFPNWFLPIGRPGIALIGGMLMIVVRYILVATDQGPEFDAEGVIIMEPLYLLFGLMLTTVYLEKMERGGLFDRLRDSLDDPINYKRSIKIMAMSTIGSAAVMNDSIVLIFSGVVVDLCVRHKVADSIPYLLSLASTANIGSALTMTGNPQNILIVSLAYDEIRWLGFAANMVLPVLASTAINGLMMLVYYRAELFPGSSGMAEAFGILLTGSKTAEMLSQERSFYARKAAAVGDVDEVVISGWSLWSKLQVLVVLLFLFFFAAGFDVSTVCISAGIILMTLNALKRRDFDEREIELDAAGLPVQPKKLYDLKGNELTPEPEELITESETILTEVDYGLLLLFIGQFLLIGSFDDTGVPQSFFAVTMGECANNMTGVPCVYWFVAIVTILSNVASNVPVCQMLAATFPYATNYEWIVTSYAATIAGNLTMLGSAANMIVSFQAAKVGDRTFTSERHAPFGIPSTLLCLYVGTAILTVVSFASKCSINLGECDEDGN